MRRLWLSPAPEHRGGKQNGSSLSALLGYFKLAGFPLQIEDERKNSNFKIRRALYDKKVGERDARRLPPRLAALTML